MKVYYWGEFGCFNFAILGLVERYLQQHPKARFEIATYEDYLNILRYLFPGVFLQSDEKKAPSPPAVRQGHGGKTEPKPRWNNLYRVLSQELHIHDRIVPLGKKIWIGDIAYHKAYVSLCCRARQHLSRKNLSPEEWNTVVDLIDGPFIVHGLEREITPVRAIDAYRCLNIHESIWYLNRSRVCITSMSGFAQFASNCGCDVIQIGDAKDHFEYAPFDTHCSRIGRDSLRSLLEIL